jgi:hypothetical protein
MKNRILLSSAFGAVLLALASCTTESISSDYQNGGARRYNQPVVAQPSWTGGELSEADLIGISGEGEITQEKIATAVRDRSFLLHPGSRVMLLQSGAPVPDQEMMDAFARNYTVIPMDGQRPVDAPKRMDLSLRLRAAGGGVDTIVVVWGVLESTEKNNAGSAVLWVPIVGMFVPDTTKMMRIRLRALVLDVKTGSWDVVIPEIFTSDVTSSGLRSDYNFTRQKLELKKKAYNDLAAKLADKFR